MPANESKVKRDREIRDVFRYLSTTRGHHTRFILEFITRHYFISSAYFYRIISNCDDQPVDKDNCSIIYTLVMKNEYQDNKTNH